jgi:hypothetical protein
MLNRSLVRDPARGPYCQVITCETAPKRDPGQDSSKLLKSSPKTPEVYVPIGADRDPTRNKNLLQCIKELRPIRGGDRFGVDSQPRSRTPRSSSTARSLASSLTRFSAKTSQRQADKKRTGARHVGHLLRQDAWVVRSGEPTGDERGVGRREWTDPEVERLLHQVDHRKAGAQIDRGFRVPGEEVDDDRPDQPHDALLAIDAELAARGRLLDAGGLVRLLQILQELHAPFVVSAADLRQPASPRPRTRRCYGAGGETSYQGVKR